MRDIKTIMWHIVQNHKTQYPLLTQQFFCELDNKGENAKLPPYDKELASFGEIDKILSLPEFVYSDVSAEIQID